MTACGGGGSDGDDDDVPDAAATDVDAEVPPDAEIGPDADPRFALGTVCASGDECLSGFCADGVCCDSACEDACGACNAAGACSPEEAGTACGTYECTGDSLECPATCSQHAQCADGAMCVGNACVLGKWAFTTSTTINGNLGGLAGGDAFCQARADAAGLPGTYRAWLADNTGTPLTRFTFATVPYYLPDASVGVIKLADDGTDLLDGTIDAPFDRTELGVMVPGNIPWSNAMANGMIVNANHCTNWTTAASNVSGQSGNSAGTDGTWAQSSVTACNILHRLFCFEQ
jgi:hypothetical protein